MKKQFLAISLFAFIILLSACGNQEKSQAQKELASLEEAYKADNSSANILIAGLKEHTAKFPDDLEVNARYMFRAGELYVAQNDLDNAIKVLNTGILNFKEKDATPKSLKLLSDLYTKMNKSTEAMNMISRLKQEYPNHPVTKETETAIPDEGALKQRITNLEKMVIDSSQSVIRNSIVRELARAYQQYAIFKPDAEDATEKLLKASYNYGTVGDFVNSTTISKTVIQLHPKTDYAKEAMFHIANLYGEMAKMNKAKKEEYNNNSKEYYEMLIKDFPNDPLAEQSKLLLNFVGKSDEELFEEVIKNTKK